MLVIPKFEKKIDQLETMVDKWAYFFKNAAQTKISDAEIVAGNDLILRQAY